MRRLPLMLACIVGSACGERASVPPAPPRVASAAPPVAAAPPAPASVGPALAAPPASAEASAPMPAAPPASAPMPEAVGHLQRPAALEKLFAALAAIEAKSATDDVRVVHYGDSHTASDLGTAVVRRALQSRFGDGGRGFVAIGKPWKTYTQDAVKTGADEDCAPQKTRFKDKKFSGDGRYGLLGAGIGASKRGARAWAEVSAPSSRIEIAYLEQPNGGTFEVLVDGVSAGRVATRGAAPKSGFFVHKAAEAPHKIEIAASGDGDVRVFGAALDRAQHGVVYDALGINGAQIFTLLRLDAAHFAEQLEHRAPHAFVLAYGTNESVESYSSETYEAKLSEIIARFRKSLPNAACLLLGPPDRVVQEQGAWKTPKKLLDIAASQKRVAAKESCAFFDQMAAMGGQGSMAKWAEEKPARGGRDRIHLTKIGYEEVGRLFAADLLRAYDTWRAPPVSASSTTPRSLR